MAGRNRFRNRRSEGIDLNALLDVIFIILMVVVCRQATEAVNLKEAEEAVMEQQEEAKATQEMYEDQIDSLENMDSYVLPVYLMVRFDPTDVKSRTIEYLVNGETNEIALNPENEEEAYEDLRGVLSGFLSEQESRILLLSLNEDDEQILYRDELAVQAVVDELSEEHDNLFLKQRKSAEESDKEEDTEEDTAEKGTEE